ncbi:gamma-glutamyl-gamma-aminobutyrate hydrolase family protein [Burkholderia sp. WAC0059]|uniref:gamma-glutamyl-gamma-aminobutyrate hydrolase family protein n=1 Tax=Burkholderia sp. WAC0059 TaxID=2066022 RepID=UPI0015E11B66|nr:gamma-glutamyl-gamma-aminobutyrate hydrolase family protein [Burkholderia sp. WAC0059]
MKIDLKAAAPKTENPPDRPDTLAGTPPSTRTATTRSTVPGLFALPPRTVPAKRRHSTGPEDGARPAPPEREGKPDEISPRELKRLLDGETGGPRTADGRLDLAAALEQAGYEKRLTGGAFDGNGGLSLSKASVKDVEFERCTFNWDALADADFSDCRWKHCKFDHASFGEARLDRCTFENSSLRNTMFVGAKLADVDFRECREIVDGSFEDATIADSTFDGCTLRGTHFLNSSISNSRIVRSNVKNAFLDGAAGRFDLDGETANTAGTTKPAVATLVSPGSRGVSVPRVGAKLQDVADVLTLRVAMQSPAQSKDALNAEVERLLGQVRRDDASGKSIAQQLLTLADEAAERNGDENPAINAIVAKARTLVGQSDAVVLPGGEDVPPELYGEPEGEHTNWGGDYRRSIMELALIRESLKKGVPLMAICRGFQMTSVYFGATLLQHIGDDQKGVRRLPATGRRDGIEGLYRGALKNLQTAVYHHQAVPEHQERLRYIEPAIIRNDWIMAVEPIYSGAAPIIGVQFHPEFLDSANATGTELSDAKLAQLSQSARTPGDHDPGLRNPADIVESGIIRYMSPNNDELWKILSTAADTYRKKKAVIGALSRRHHPAPAETASTHEA